MRATVLILFLAAYQPLCAQDNTNSASLPLMPVDILIKIVVELSDSYSAQTLIALFTCSKNLHRHIAEKNSLQLWQTVALKNHRFANDTFIHEKFQCALLKQKFSLAKILMGYGGIKITGKEFDKEFVLEPCLTQDHQDETKQP